MGCKQCGLCCAGLFIPAITHAMLYGGRYRGDPSIAFAGAHWKPITQEEGKLRAPWVDYPVAFFECDQYDQINRRCMAHECKPPVCRNYPYYGKDRIDLNGLPPGCGYREVVEKGGNSGEEK